jgi:hypothetical protein
MAFSMSSTIQQRAIILSSESMAREIFDVAIQNYLLSMLSSYNWQLELISLI